MRAAQSWRNLIQVLSSNHRYQVGIDGVICPNAILKPRQQDALGVKGTRQVFKQVFRRENCPAALGIEDHITVDHREQACR
jgi:hypothetical protein